MKSKLLLVTFLFLILIGSLMANNEILNKVDFNGEVGVNYNFHSNDDNSFSDISVSNFDLSLKVEPFENIAGYLSLIYSDGMSSIEVDEAYAKIKLMEEYSLALTIGNFYQPTSIALDYSNFIADPSTYSFTELSELAIMGEITWNEINFKASIYNDDYYHQEENDYEWKAKDDDSVDNSNLDSFVLNVSTEKEIEDVNIIASGSYISNLLSSGNFPDLGANDSDKYEMSAISLGTTANWSDYSFIGEYVISLDKFNKDNPSLLYTELSYLLKNGIVVAGNFSLSQNAENILEESSMGLALNYTFMETDFSTATIASEFLHTSAYDDFKENIFRVKLSLEF